MEFSYYIHLIMPSVNPDLRHHDPLGLARGARGVDEHAGLVDELLLLYPVQLRVRRRPPHLLGPDSIGKKNLARVMA